MTPSRRSALAAACFVLWLALTGPVRDEGGGSAVRPAAVEVPAGGPVLEADPLVASDI